MARSTELIQKTQAHQDLREEIRVHHPQLLAEIRELELTPHGERAMVGLLNRVTKLNLPTSGRVSDYASIYLKRLKEMRLRMTLDTVFAPAGLVPIHTYDLPNAKDAWI